MLNISNVAATTWFTNNTTNKNVKRFKYFIVLTMTSTFRGIKGDIMPILLSRTNAGKQWHINVSLCNDLFPVHTTMCGRMLFDLTDNDRKVTNNSKYS